MGRIETPDLKRLRASLDWYGNLFHESEMALFSECMLQCARNFRTISDFRKLHLPVLHGLFDQVLQIALQAGTMKLGRVVLDGSKVKANASKHKAMSYGRMQEDERRIKEEVKR